jgi:hypothetical protein
MQPLQLILAVPETKTMLGGLLLHPLQGGGQSCSVGGQLPKISEICRHARNLLLPTHAFGKVLFE